MPLDLPPLIGHRGAAAAAPENTLISLRTARRLGARWVEFDVKLTRDGVPVLLHDDRLDRATSGRGRVRDLTLDALQALDAGAWFGPGFAGERVPTFATALALCAELGLGINVEIKPCPGRAEETARRVIEILQAHWPAAAPTPLISSFEHRCLAVAAELAPELPRGYLCNRIPKDWLAELARYGCATLNANARWITGRQIAGVVAAGVPLLLYTVNDPTRARALRAAGVSALFTDRVDAVGAALG
jgi:glycerophosphoryl diester phosphodiesterase